ncbi:hypothetical protein GVY41_04470 [Frigidibacter albus]|uniref:Uncharacterized protein n=1 Tax=Frigidibacter albus TaxID=1465486 RepID=A0A6L8VED8_9RHOB|nr:hypothetical protein [Frigidibacter albus]MZQ88066.1 hypothetical protein [Frigidibacter albus]NBE30260.1 hypothetical protein [Frigidibacter albus]GGH47683.1 hypothetical protein GCM10011341_08990 [Frigidibacter albus]
MLRLLCLCLIVTLLLPWGAGQGLRHAVQAKTAMELSAEPEQPALRVTATHRCPGPALPGTPCGLDLAPAEVRTDAQMTADLAVPGPRLMPVPPGRSTQPPLGPPRAA